MEGRVRAWLEASPYGAALGVRARSVDAASARLRLPFKEENSNPGGALHGGVAASLVDLAGQAVARMALGPESSPWHTCALQVNYLAAAISEPIEAEARLLRKGKQLCHAGVRVSTDEGKAIAEGIAIVRGRFGEKEPPTEPARGDEGAADPGPMGPHLHRIPFVKRLGLVVENMMDARSRIRMPFQPHLAEAPGRVHEGPVLGLLDTTGAMAAWAMTGYGPYKASTVGIQAQMLTGAREGDLVGYGRLARRDREIFWSDVEIAESAGGGLVARGTVIYRIVVPGDGPEEGTS